MCLTPLSKIFLLYRGSQFYSWGKPAYHEKTTNLPRVTDKLYHIMYRIHITIRIELTALEMTDTDSTGIILCLVMETKLLNGVKVGIQLTGLALPHCCSRPKPGNLF